MTCYVILYYDMLYCIIWYYTILYHIMLYYITVYHNCYICRCSWGAQPFEVLDRRREHMRLSVRPIQQKSASNLHRLFSQPFPSSFILWPTRPPEGPAMHWGSGMPCKYTRLVSNSAPRWSCRGSFTACHF